MKLRPTELYDLTLGEYLDMAAATGWAQEQKARGFKETAGDSLPGTTSTLKARMEAKRG